MCAHDLAKQMLQLASALTGHQSYACPLVTSHPVPDAPHPLPTTTDKYLKPDLHGQRLLHHVTAQHLMLSRVAEVGSPPSPLPAPLPALSGAPPPPPKTQPCTHMVCTSRMTSLLSITGLLKLLTPHATITQRDSCSPVSVTGIPSGTLLLLLLVGGR